ncbi:MAG: helix-turn-helix transcriptional regulator [Planctomycetaceae bacterium]|nr:helix-turn-helix transcriptional regulator [Planctomycetaceae bacterium]
MPAEVRARWERSLADLDPNQIEADFAKSEAAAAEDTFSGFLRRCVHGSGKTISMLVIETDVSRDRLSHFLRGEGVLDSAEIDRLLAILGVNIAKVTSE